MIPKPGSGDPQVTAWLATMAAFRQASVSDETLDLYSAQLAADGIALEDIEAACHEIARAERAEGETAFPDYGRLVRYCRAAAHTRYAHAQREQRQRVLQLQAARDEQRMSPEDAKLWLARLKAASKGQRVE